MMTQTALGADWRLHSYECGLVAVEYERNAGPHLQFVGMAECLIRGQVSTPYGGAVLNWFGVLLAREVMAWLRTERGLPVWLRDMRRPDEETLLGADGSMIKAAGPFIRKGRDIEQLDGVHELARARLIDLLWFSR